MQRNICNKSAYACPPHMVANEPSHRGQSDYGKLPVRLRLTHSFLTSISPPHLCPGNSIFTHNFYHHLRCQIIPKRYHVATKTMENRKKIAKKLGSYYIFVYICKCINEWEFSFMGAVNYNVINKKVCLW